MTQALISTASKDRGDDQYLSFLRAVDQRFAFTRQYRLFTTDATGLWEAFLGNLPTHAQQHYNCNACRHFIERYGSLVFVNPDQSGIKESAFWFDVPPFFSESIRAMRKLINKSKITGVFVSSENVFGQPVTGDWHHICGYANASAIWGGLTKTAFQQSAELKECYIMLTNSLKEYPLPVARQAYKLLNANAVYRSEKVLGPAKFLYELHMKRKSLSPEHKNNITWLAIASSPVGYFHIKNSMIGTLMDDIVTGLSGKEIAARFKKKMNPLDYQRPKAAPSVGQVGQAEKIIEKLGAAGSLRRRFARLDEIKTIWMPAQLKRPDPAGGVFSTVKTKTKTTNPQVEVETAPITMSWTKFQSTVLPDARSMQIFAGTRHGYAAILTAAEPDAPPIIQWDLKEARNPFSWYYLAGSSTPQHWNMKPGWVNVTGVCFKPCMWLGSYPQFGMGVMFVLEGCKDTRKDGGPGNCIFPEILKSEFHGIRQTIEAYSSQAQIDGFDQASACGLMLNDSSSDWNINIKVSSDLGVMNYVIDRWD